MTIRDTHIYPCVLSSDDMSAEITERLLECALRNKGNTCSTVLKGHSLALVFEKPSLRTRVSFELAMFELGGVSLILRPDEIQMGKRESVQDVAAYLSRNVTIAALRVYRHETLREFAEAATIPVINALSDIEHPCQALADIMTVHEHCGTLAGRRIVYVGDGNNVCHSLLLTATKMGVSVTVACPEGYAPAADILSRARVLAAAHNCAVSVSHSPQDAVAGADAVYTDVWTSMGQEDEKAERALAFAPFQLNAALMSHAPEACVMHCLPAHRGEEITADVIDGAQSVVFNQAENRRHVQKALLQYVCGRLE